ncbi:MAG TPA: hypothetical protein VFF33_03915 [Ignavibacteriaceae bacterium]|nr:hypothetical protein [Ignavibacteriaceae bacterium]
MNIKKIAAVYSLVLGSGIILFWMYLLLDGFVPEINTKPTEILFHLIAEFTTAIFLFISSVFMYENFKGGTYLNLTSMGMLFYSLIQTPGYFFQIGESLVASIFLICLLVGIVIYSIILIKEITFSNP